MSTKSELIKILENSRDEFVSGQELADRLNVSRTAIWKIIKNLEHDGYIFDASTNKGYRLEKSGDVLSEEAIKCFLPLEINKITVLKSVDSTNSYARKLATEGACHGDIVIAEEQTQGRGRPGKSFYSPKNTGLYMSVILRPQNDMTDPQRITIATADAVCEAIEKLTEINPQIKWVNDIFLNGNKVCGILTEAVTDFESGGIESIVVGVGINCTTSKFPDNLRDIACSIGNLEINRNELAAEVATGIIERFKNLDDKKIIEYYKSRSMMNGKWIKFTQNRKSYRGIVTGINDMGNLLVSCDDGEDFILNSGEITMEVGR